VAVVAVDGSVIERLCGRKRAKIIEGLGEIGMPTEEEGNTLMMEVTPNRPDLFSAEGIARALKAYYGGEPRQYRAEQSDYVLRVGKGTEKVRPFVRCSVVRGVGMDDEFVADLMQMQEKLHDTVGRKRKKVAVGIHDLAKVKFPLEYVVASKERFVPLEFTEKMGVPEILEGHPKGRQYGHLAKPKAVVISDEKGVISFPPIINSERTRVTKKSRDLLVDVTGTHRETVEGVLNMVTIALADRGGKIFEVEIGGKRYPDLDGKAMPLDLEGANRVLGLSLSREDAAACLRRMGHACDGKTVRVPAYRVDIISFIDLVEDIAIGYGYGNFEPELPPLPGTGRISASRGLIDQAMCGMGFVEVKNYILADGKLMERLGKGKGIMKICNSRTVEFDVIRTCLAPGLLADFATNKTKGLPQKFYEVGVAYEGEERGKLCFAEAGVSAGLSTIQESLQALLKEMKVGYRLVEGKDEMFIEGRCFIVESEGKKIGVIGEIHPKTLEEFGLEYPAALCEIEVKYLW